MGKLLRVLCLHGYAQNKTVMEKHMRKWQEAVKDKVEFVYASGPLEAIVSDQTKHKQMELATAGKRLDLEPLKAWVLTTTRNYVGFQESLTEIQEVVEREGPFDGVMGFSQGAAVAGLLIHLHYYKNRSSQYTHFPKFQFAIMIGGFTPRDTLLMKLFKSPVSVPSFHVIGKEDTAIPPEWSHHLATHFHDPTVIVHDGGHIIPNHPDHISKFVSFIDNLPPTIRDPNPNPVTKTVLNSKL